MCLSLITLTSFDPLSHRSRANFAQNIFASKTQSIHTDPALKSGLRFNNFCILTDPNYSINISIFFASSRSAQKAEATQPGVKFSSSSLYCFCVHFTYDILMLFIRQGHFVFTVHLVYLCAICKVTEVDAEIHLSEIGL